MNRVSFQFGPDMLFRLIFGGVFGLVGTAMLIGAAISYFNAQNLVKYGMNATGTVIGMRSSISRDSKGRSSTTWTPVVRYTAADGQEQTFTSSVSSSPPSYHEGQQVKVVYDPATPTKAEINDFMTMYFLPPAQPSSQSHRPFRRAGDKPATAAASRPYPRHGSPVR